MIGLLFGKHVVVESVDLNYGNQSRKSFFIWGVEEEESNSQTKSKNPRRDTSKQASTQYDTTENARRQRV